MATYKVKIDVECLTQPVSGNKSGQWLQAGETFSSTTVQSSWVKVSDKRWIPLSACDAVTTPPPVDPDPETPPTPNERFIHVLELVDSQWVSLKYLRIIEA